MCGHSSYLITESVESFPKADTILIAEGVLSGEYSCVGWIYLIESLIIAQC